jgi:hypothetical protein
MQQMSVSNATAAPTGHRGRFTWPGLALALAAAPVVGLVCGWIGASVQTHFAPLVLFPLLLGVFAGFSIVGFVRFTRIGNRPTIFLAALVAAGVTVATQHYFTYLAQYYGSGPAVSPTTGQDLTAIKRELAPGFGRYLCAQARRGRPLAGGYVVHDSMAWVCWAIDALLVAAAAVAATVPAVRVPYCNRCGSWYRTVRSGRIDEPSARRLAELLGVEETERLHSPRYRLSTCQSGCGPTRCDLSWEETSGAVDLARAWLDAGQRNQVGEILDGLTTENDEGRMTNDERMTKAE